MRNATFALAASLALVACHSTRPETVVPTGYQDERGIDRRAVLLSDWQPTYPQRCAVAQYPTVLPSVDSIISTSDMPFLLKQGGIEMARGSALLSLKWDSTGKISRAHVIEGDIADDVRPALEQVVLAALHAQPPGREWGVRLRIDLDSVPRYRVGRSERCAAVLAPSQPQSAGPGPLTERVVGVVAVPAGGTTSVASMPPAAKRTSVLKYLIAVGARGEVVEVKQVGAASEDASLLAAYRERLARERWLPELDDRVPVETIVEHTERIQAFTSMAP